MRTLILFAAVLLFSMPNLLAQEDPVEIQFYWDSHIVQRTGIEDRPEGRFRVDTNRADFLIPLHIGAENAGFDVIGVGQIFAPRSLYSIYDPIYNGPDSTTREQPYIDQFKGVQNWALEAVRMSFFDNPDKSSTTEFSIADFWRMDEDFTDPANSDSVRTWRRDALEEQRIINEPFIFIDQGLDSTIDDERIHPTILTFDPPVEFGKEESVMMAFYSTAPPISGSTEGKTWQRFLAYLEYRNGDDTRNTDSTTLFSNPLPRSMVNGLFMTKRGDTVNMTNTYSLSYVDGAGNPTVPVLMDFNVEWFGTVTLLTSDTAKSSVDYHFGYDATNQGLEDIRPNPVREEAAVPFSLTKVSTVTLELYTAEGQKVMTLLENERYVPGKYTARFSSTDLPSGTYLVRMTADESIYSMKFNVTK